MTKKLIKALRKIIILIVGLPIVALGIVLIPLPGPGLLITLAGLLILSLEFDRAKKYRDRLKEQLMKLKNEIMEHQKSDKNSK